MGAQCSVSQPHVQEAKCLLNESLGEEALAAVSELASVLTCTNQQIFKTPLKYHSLINVGMIATQCKREEGYARPPASGSKQFADTALLTRAARYAKYAKAAYCTEQAEILEAIQGGEGEFGGNVEVLHVQMPAGAPPPSLAKKPSSLGFFIAADKATGEIVLSIRGRATAQEAMADVAGETAPFLDGSAPRGLLASSRDVIRCATDPLNSALKNSPDSTFAVVGHGVGAGLAVLATLQSFGEGSAVEPLLAAGRAKCYAFAPPPVVEASELPKECASAIYSFVNGMDCVPRACPAAVGKLLLAVRKVDELDVDLPTRLRFLGSEDVPAMEKLPDHEELPEELSSELKSFGEVGTTVFLFKGKDGRMNCERLSPEQTDRIFLHPDMAKDHAMAGYEESIAEMLMQLQRSKGCC